VSLALGMIPLQSPDLGCESAKELHMLEIVKEPKHWAANDPINRYLGVLARRSGWTEECDRARYALEAELKRRGFIEWE